GHCRWPVRHHPEGGGIFPHLARYGGLDAVGCGSAGQQRGQRGVASFPRGRLGGLAAFTSGDPQLHPGLAGPPGHLPAGDRSQGRLEPRGRATTGLQSPVGDRCCVGQCRAHVDRNVGGDHGHGDADPLAQGDLAAADLGAMISGEVATEVLHCFNDSAVEG
ncbi:unnamed protein product, partial [Effrenium voratum]